MGIHKRFSQLRSKSDKIYRHGIEKKGKHLLSMKNIKKEKFLPSLSTQDSYSKQARFKRQKQKKREGSKKFAGLIDVKTKRRKSSSREFKESINLAKKKFSVKTDGLQGHENDSKEAMPIIKPAIPMKKTLLKRSSEIEDVTPPYFSSDSTIIEKLSSDRVDASISDLKKTSKNERKSEKIIKPTDRLNYREIATQMPSSSGRSSTKPIRLKKSEKTKGMTRIKIKKKGKDKNKASSRTLDSKMGSSGLKIARKVKHKQTTEEKRKAKKKKDSTCKNFAMLRKSIGGRILFSDRGHKANKKQKIKDKKRSSSDKNVESADFSEKFSQPSTESGSKTKSRKNEKKQLAKFSNNFSRKIFQLKPKEKLRKSHKKMIECTKCAQNSKLRTLKTKRSTTKSIGYLSNYSKIIPIELTKKAKANIAKSNKAKLLQKSSNKKQKVLKEKINRQKKSHGTKSMDEATNSLDQTMEDEISLKMPSKANGN